LQTSANTTQILTSTHAATITTSFQSRSVMAINFFENTFNFHRPNGHCAYDTIVSFCFVLPWRYEARNTMVLSFIAQAGTSPTGSIEEKVAASAPVLHRRLHQQDMGPDVVMSLVAVLVLVSLFDFIRRRKQTGASRPSTGLQTQETGITDCSTSSHQDTPPPDSTSQPA